MDEIEIQIDDIQSRIRSIWQEKISGDNIYHLLLAFDQVYGSASEVERKEFMRAFIERIELYPEKPERKARQQVENQQDGAGAPRAA